MRERRGEEPELFYTAQGFEAMWKQVVGVTAGRLALGVRPHGQWGVLAPICSCLLRPCGITLA